MGAWLWLNGFLAVTIFCGVPCCDCAWMSILMWLYINGSLAVIVTHLLLYCVYDLFDILVWLCLSVCPIVTVSIEALLWLCRYGCLAVTVTEWMFFVVLRITVHLTGSKHHCTCSFAYRSPSGSRMTVRPRPACCFLMCTPKWLRRPIAAAKVCPIVHIYIRCRLLRHL